MDKAPHKSKDNSIKMILDEPEMLVAFLKDFVPIDILKDVKPSDISDVKPRLLTLVSEQKDSDTIKRINLQQGDTPLFVIALIEHESSVNFRAPFKMLLYIALVLDAYEKEIAREAKKKNKSRKKGKNKGESEDKGESENPSLLKDFRYPPVLPIVFYDGGGEWTASMNFLHRTEMHDIFERYIPKFEYELVDLTEYSTEDLVKFGDLLSLFMILNKVKRPDSLGATMDSLPEDYIEKISANVPENLRLLLANVIKVMLAKIDVPPQEVDEIASKVYEKGVSAMFRNFNLEGYSVTETRREARAEGLAEGVEEGLARVARNALKKGMPVSDIAELTGLVREDIEALRT